MENLVDLPKHFMRISRFLLWGANSFAPESEGEENNINTGEDILDDGIFWGLT